MTREEAEQLLDANPSLGQRAGGREQAIMALMRMDKSQIPMSAGAAIRPQGAIANAMMLVPPRVVTPASPAPMQPGIPLQAPKPTAPMVPQRRQILPDDVRQMAMQQATPQPEPQPQPDQAVAPVPEVAPSAAPQAQGARPYVSPTSLALRAAEQELEMLNSAAEEVTKNGQPLPPEAKLRLDLAERKVAQYRAQVSAEQGAQIPQELADVFGRQEARLTQEGERIGKDEKNIRADALIKAGLAMMNPQRGANFLAALSSGVGQGLESYDAGKAAIAERRARLGQGQDAIILQRYDALTKAREAARLAAENGQKMDKDNLALKNATNQELYDMATMPYRIETAKSEASIKSTDARFAPLKAQADLDATQALIGARNAQAKAALMRKDSKASDFKGGASIYAALLQSNTNLDKIIADPLVDAATKKEAKATKAANNREIGLIKEKMGIGTPPAASEKPPVAGAQKAPNGKWYVKDPKRPGKYLEVSS